MDTSQKLPSHKLDRWGYEVHTESDACIEHIDSYYLQVLAYGRHQKIILKAVEADNGCALALALSAAYAFSQASENAVSHLAAARTCLVDASEYEKMVLNAVAALVEGQRELTLKLHSEILKHFPRDLVSLKRAQVLCFYMGIPNESLKLAVEVLPANKEEAYMYGMLAFPLLETHRFDDAENAARKALAIEEKDQWAQHALCHVLQSRCHFSEAITFMEKSSESWNSCGSFMYSHNWWHLALLYMEWGCDHALDKVLEIYDQHIWPAHCRDVGGYVQVLLNALGLLLRLHLRSYLNCVDERISAVTELLCDQAFWHKEWLLDLLAVWALAYVDQSNKSYSLLKQLESRVYELDGKEEESSQMCLNLAKGLYEYGRGNYEEAFAVLGPFDIYKLKTIGASDEQLEVFEELWCIVSLRSSVPIQEVSDVLKRRTAETCGTPFTWSLMEQLHNNSGSPEKAKTAAKKAGVLKESYLQFIAMS